MKPHTYIALWRQFGCWGSVLLVVFVMLFPFALPSIAAPLFLHTSVTVRMYALNRNGSRTETLCAANNTLYGCTAFEGDPNHAYPYGVNPANVLIETDYLLDVVAQEMSPELYTEAAALQAQAIASRSFVNYYINNPPDPPYDNSSQYQAFIPYRYERLTAAAQQHVSVAVAPQHYIASVVPLGNELPAKALFAADIFEHTDSALGDKPYFVGVVEPISTACDADDEATNRYGMSQQGANRWARGHECSWEGAQIAPGNPPGTAWSVRWPNAAQILVHYYTGVHIRDASNNNAILTPDHRWNPLRVDWGTENNTTPVMVTGGSYPVTVTVQNTGVDTWTIDSRTWALSYHWAKTGHVETDSTNRAWATQAVLAGNPPYTFTLTINDRPDWGRGMYTLKFDRLMRLGAEYWFSRDFVGLNWITYDVQVYSEYSVFLPIALKNYAACIEGGALIQNGNFEQGHSAWTEQGTTIIRTDLPTPAHGGIWAAWFGGYNMAQDKMYQEFIVPNDITSANLIYYVWMGTEETPRPTAYDHLYVRLYDSAGGLVRDLDHIDNQAAEHVWLQRSIPLDGLDAWVGQRLRLSFEASTDSSEITNFIVDDVSLSMHCSSVTSFDVGVTPVPSQRGTNESMPELTKPPLLQ